MKCPYCGEEIREGSKFCPFCGGDLEQTVSGEEMPESPDKIPGSPEGGKKPMKGLIAILIVICAAIVVLIVVLVLHRNRNLNEPAVTETETEESVLYDSSLDEGLGPEDFLPETEEADETETLTDSGGETAAAKAVASDISFERKRDNDNEYAVVTAKDESGNTVWEYQTPEYAMTELDRTSAIGREGDSYYLVQGGSVVSLDAETGTTNWENPDFQGSPADGASAFGDDVVYLSGYYGPDFYAVTTGGDTVSRIDEFDSNYFWPYELEVQGDTALVTLDSSNSGGEGPYYFQVNLQNFTYEQVDGPASSGSGFSMLDVSEVTASSSLYESQYDIDHSPSSLIDGSLSNAWCENAAGQGVGEWVKLTFNGTYEINGIKINAGYQKDDDLYNKNSRPKEIYISFSDGSGVSFTLSDEMTQQNIAFSAPVSTSSVTITIQSVYPGNKYEDTLISEISIY
ncbi:MAG: discoidin domain-containing protein [Lachnospiraceae bacterium]|nr:discoidin domain-containing protein [Lachnospiraceae bacterium]